MKVTCLSASSNTSRIYNVYEAYCVYDIAIELHTNKMLVEASSRASLQKR